MVGHFHFVFFFSLPDRRRTVRDWSLVHLAQGGTRPHAVTNMDNGNTPLLADASETATSFPNGRAKLPCTLR